MVACCWSSAHSPACVTIAANRSVCPAIQFVMKPPKDAPSNASRCGSTSGRASTASSTRLDLTPDDVGAVGPRAVDGRLPVSGRERRVGQDHRPAVRHRDPRVPPPAPRVVRPERAAVDPLHHRRRARRTPAAGTASCAPRRRRRRRRARRGVPAAAGSGPGWAARPGSGRSRRWPAAPASGRSPTPSAARRSPSRPAPGTGCVYTASAASRAPQLARRRDRGRAPRRGRASRRLTYSVAESADHTHSVGVRSPSAIARAPRPSTPMTISCSAAGTSKPAIRSTATAMRCAVRRHDRAGVLRAGRRFVDRAPSRRHVDRRRRRRSAVRAGGAGARWSPQCHRRR